MSDKVRHLEMIRKQIGMNTAIVAGGMLTTMLVDGYYFAMTKATVMAKSLGMTEQSAFSGEIGIIAITVLMWLVCANHQDKANRFRGLYEKVAAGNDVGFTLDTGKPTAIAQLATLWSVPVGLFFIGTICALIFPAVA